MSAMSVTDRTTSPESKVNDGKLDELMNRLRTKTAKIKSWEETAKSLRMSMQDKRSVLDNIDRGQLQKCLDSLQKAIKVTSIETLVERLDSISRQLGLKFTCGHTRTECYISSDMFYVEILLEPNGFVKDAKITHHRDPVSCDEITQVLRRGDFAEFTKHLQGLAAIYQINADKSQKTKAYQALQSLETDLTMLDQLQRCNIPEVPKLIHGSPLGVLQPRKGGYPLKLTYLVSPYELLDVKAKTSIPLSIENVIEKDIGHSLTVSIEASTAQKLQTRPLMSVAKTSDGKSLPSFDALSNLISSTLPACFVLRLTKPMPCATSLVKKIQAITKMECADMNTAIPMLELLVKHLSEETNVSLRKGLSVNLPDQQHCYFLNESRDLSGVLVTRIPFCHPTHVPQVVSLLRQQALFNCVIGSCVRKNGKCDRSNSLVFEINPLSVQCICVTFQHPLEETLATVQVDLSEISNIKCEIETSLGSQPICDNEYATKVMQRCWSIPVTMRAVIKKAMLAANIPSLPDSAATVVSNQPGTSSILHGLSDSNSNEVKFHNDPNAGHTGQNSMFSQYSLADTSQPSSLSLDASTSFSQQQQAMQQQQQHEQCEQQQQLQQHQLEQQYEQQQLQQQQQHQHQQQMQQQQQIQQQHQQQMQQHQQQHVQHQQQMIQQSQEDHSENLQQQQDQQQQQQQQQFQQEQLHLQVQQQVKLEPQTLQMSYTQSQQQQQQQHLSQQEFQMKQHQQFLLQQQQIEQEQHQQRFTHPNMGFGHEQMHALQTEHSGAHNPMLTTMLQDVRVQQKPTPMLKNLLSDSFEALPPLKGRKPRKRKSLLDPPRSPGRSPKRTRSVDDEYDYQYSMFPESQVARLESSLDSWIELEKAKEDKRRWSGVDEIIDRVAEGRVAPTTVTSEPMNWEHFEGFKEEALHYSNQFHQELVASGTVFTESGSMEPNIPRSLMQTDFADQASVSRLTASAEFAIPKPPDKTEEKVAQRRLSGEKFRPLEALDLSAHMPEFGELSAYDMSSLHSDAGPAFSLKRSMSVDTGTGVLMQQPATLPEQKPKKRGPKPGEKRKEKGLNKKKGQSDVFPSHYMAPSSTGSVIPSTSYAPVAFGPSAQANSSSQVQNVTSQAMQLTSSAPSRTSEMSSKFSQAKTADASLESLSQPSQSPSHLSQIPRSAPSQLATRPSQTPPRPNQTPPQPSHTPPRPSQTPPCPNQTPPRPSQTPPRPSQTPPRPSQTPPRPSQTPPRPSQTPPRPSQTPPTTIQMPVRPSQMPTTKPSQVLPKSSQAPVKSTQAPSKPSQSTAKPPVTSKSQIPPRSLPSISSQAATCSAMSVSQRSSMTKPKVIVVSSSNKTIGAQKVSVSSITGMSSGSKSQSLLKPSVSKQGYSAKYVNTASKPGAGKVPCYVPTQSVSKTQATTSSSTVQGLVKQSISKTSSPSQSKDNGVKSNSKTSASSGSVTKVTSITKMQKVSNKNHSPTPKNGKPLNSTKQTSLTSGEKSGIVKQNKTTPESSVREGTSKLITKTAQVMLKPLNIPSPKVSTSTSEELKEQTSATPDAAVATDSSSGKPVVRPGRKGSLSAVIDKLKQGSGSTHVNVSSASPQPDKKDMGKDRSKLLVTKTASPKQKTDVSKKGNSIKLTVTKTMGSDGTTKLTSSVSASKPKSNVNMADSPSRVAVASAMSHVVSSLTTKSVKDSSDQKSSSSSDSQLKTNSELKAGILENPSIHTRDSPSDSSAKHKPIAKRTESSFKPSDMPKPVLEMLQEEHMLSVKTMGPPKVDKKVIADKVSKPTEDLDVAKDVKKDQGNKTDTSENSSLVKSVPIVSSGKPSPAPSPSALESPHTMTRIKRHPKSPFEEISSPEDNLFIDYPATPKSAQASKPSPIPISKPASDATSPVPAKSPVKAATSAQQSLSSPLTPFNHSNPSSVKSVTSCIIDDDLMDEALVGLG